VVSEERQEKRRWRKGFYALGDKNAAPTETYRRRSKTPVNRLVAGSNPARGAIAEFEL
jgi:hypothetical protein